MTAAPPGPAPAPAGRRVRLLVAAGFAVIVLVTVGVIALVIASGGAPKVRVSDVPAPSAADAAACRSLQAVLPESVGDGLPTRSVEPNSPLLHAWGTPAAVLRCGVPRPASYDPAGVNTVVNGVEWYSAQVGDATVWWTFRRSPRVSFAIPNSYPIPGDLLVSLTKALQEGTTKVAQP